MANKKNKVKFNIRNVHYAKLTIGEDGSITYSTPVAMPGAVSLSLDPNGEPSVFYADGYAYYTISNNQGYDGDLGPLEQTSLRKRWMTTVFLSRMQR